MSAETSHQNILEVVRVTREALRKSDRKVADAILADPELFDLMALTDGERRLLRLQAPQRGRVHKPMGRRADRGHSWRRQRRRSRWPDGVAVDGRAEGRQDGRRDSLVHVRHRW